MAGRSGRRRLDPGSPLVDLDAVFADDALIDAIAGQTWGGEPPRFGSGPVGPFAPRASRGSLLTVDPLTELFESWRQELADSPIPAPPSALRTPAPVQRRPPSRSRTLRPALAMAAAIAALLFGAASVGSKDAPRESPLFALTQVLWPSRAASVASADQVGVILAEARSALDDNRVQDAQLALLRATVELGHVDAVDGKGDMQEQVAALWVEAAPQGVPTGSQPWELTGTSRPTTPGTSSPDVRAAQISPSLGSLAAQAAAGPTVAGQLAAVQLVAPPAVAPPVLSTGVVQAALGAGWPSSQAASPPVSGPAVTDVAAPAGSAAPAVPVVTVPPVAETASTPQSVPSIPPPPTAPVDPPAEVSASDPPSATEQSPPAPTPSKSGPSVETTAPDSAGPLSMETDASVRVDPASTGTG